MKRILLLSGLLIVLFSACKKQTFNDTRQATIDDLKIQAYIKANHIDGLTKDASGIYYRVITQAPGPHPTATDTVQTQTTGQLLNGTVFQAAAVGITDLPDAVRGFQIGMTFIGADGVTKPYARIRMIIPSALGYGTAGNSDGSVPGNECLDFTVDLIGFYN